MPKAMIRMIKHAGVTFIELPEVGFNGREILVRVLPTDNPANLAVTCMKQLKSLMTREALADINSAGIVAVPKKRKLIVPN